MGLDVDELIVELGQFGKYQKILFSITCIAAIFCGQPVVMLNFVSFLPNYRCYIQGCDNADSPVYDDYFVNYTIPEKEDSEEFKLDSCLMYKRVENDTFSGIWPNVLQNIKQDFDTCLKNDFSDDDTLECQKWIYEKNEFGIYSTVEEFELTCSNQWLGSMAAGSSYMIGMLFGGLSLGTFSDKYGRKPGFLLSLILMSGGGLGCALSVDNIMFLIMRFISGIGAVGFFQVAFIIAVEFVGPKYRTLCGILINIPFALGESSVGLLAYFITDWRQLVYAISCPPFILLLSMFFLPESFRWLLSKGRNEKALVVLEKAAKANKTSLSEQSVQQIKSEEVNKSGATSTSVIDLLRTSNMRKRTLTQFFIWMVCTLTYYGLSSNAGNLGGNIYVNFVATMLIEIPSYIFVFLVLDRMGRKGTLCFVMMLGGISCVICGFIPEDIEWLTTTFSLLGKFGISGAFSIIYMYSAELFPTDYRSVGVGTCSTCARIGGILASVISALGAWFKPLPFLIFGILSVLAGGLVVLLPETVGAQLPENLQESENFGTDQGMFYFSCFKKRGGDESDVEKKSTTS